MRHHGSTARRTPWRRHAAVLPALLLAACQELPTRPAAELVEGPPAVPGERAHHDIAIHDLNPPGATASSAVAVSRNGAVLLTAGPGTSWLLWRDRSFEAVPALDARPGLSVADMNGAGLVVGAYRPADAETRAFAYHLTTGSFTDRAAPGLDIHATAVNQTGLVAGYTASDNGEDAFTWDAAAGTSLALLPRLAEYDRCRAADLNDAGLVVGSCQAGATATAVAWVDGQPVELPGLGGPDSRAAAVNTDGRIAGTSDDADGRPTLVFWTSPGAPPTPVARVARPVVAGITDHGWITGQADDPTTGGRNAFLMAGGTIHWLPALAEPSSHVARMSAHGLLVGSSADHAARWTVDVLVDPGVIIGRMSRIVGGYVNSGQLDEPDARYLLVRLDAALEALLAGDDRAAMSRLRWFIDGLERLVRESRMAGVDARPLVNAALAAVDLIRMG